MLSLSFFLVLLRCLAESSLLVIPIATIGSLQMWIGPQALLAALVNGFARLRLFPRMR